MKIMCISDTHYPYAHPDHLDFLKALKAKYKFGAKDRYIHLGDEADYSALSFHDSDPDLPNSTRELDLAKEDIHKLEKVFPKLDLLNSNHGSMVYRKRKFHGFPKQVIKDYADILEVNKKNWKWHDNLIVKDKFGSYYFTHSMNADCLKSAQALNYEGYIQSHFHSRFEVKFFSSPESLRWGATIGCLIDKDSLAFAYSRVNIKRPVLGCLVIIDGVPILEPMILRKGNRWVGKL